jgi:ATP-dependent helicase Lhr and Lhr-like helicase
VNEVMKDVLTEAMDIDGLKSVLSGLADGRIRCLAVDTPVPSQFSHEILNANPYAFLDDAPLEERRARAVQMRRMLPESVLEEVGGLDPAAIAQVREEAWPEVRDADELHDVLHTLVALPESGRDFSTVQWKSYFDRLVGEGRAASAVNSGRIYWVSAERAKTFSVLFPEARFAQELVDVETTVPTRDGALLTTVTGWMSHLGPTTATQLGETLGIGASEISSALLRMEASGTVLRGSFSGPAQLAGAPAPHALSQEHETEWCERRLLARIHRLTVVTLRKQIEPVTAAQFMQWLLRWQHLAAGTQVAGERGTLEVLRQLQGFEIPANAWERQVLARRIVDYDPKWLDQLCLTGAVGWGRLSPHPATLDSTAGRGSETGVVSRRRVIPTSVAPITFFIREDADWMTPRHPGAEQAANNGLSHVAQMVLDFLRQRGASFFADIVRGTDKLKAEIETALWELVAGGLVTADGFDNLRSLIDPKRRAGQGSGRTTRPRHNAGRWAVLHTDDVVERPRAVEAACWMLLRRYGIVVRDVLAREANLPPWRELLAGFRRLEDRGEIRGGRFVDGFLGEQFALPVAVESVRAMRKLEATSGSITLSAADPLNLVGILVPGDRVPAISGNSVTFRDGAAVPIPAVASAGDEAVAS